MKTDIFYSSRKQILCCVLCFCRDTLKELAEFGHKQQEALIKRQEQLEEAHQRLVANSKSISAA